MVCLHLYDTITDFDPSDDRDVLEEAAANDEGNEARREVRGK